MAEEKQPLSNISGNDNEQMIDNSNTANFRAQKDENCMASCRRYSFSIIHFIVMVFYTFYLLELDANNVYRKLVLISCGWIYCVRVMITMHVMLQRRVAIEEVFGVALILYPILHFSFGFKMSIDINKNFQYVDILYIFLYVIGSFFNTYSEFQRKQFKKLLTSQGKLYTKGLFSLTRHPNYFGDCLLFCGWGLLTWKWWNIWATVMMSCGFLFYHIPDLEKYLKKRYSNEWDEYQKNVAPFIPFIHFPKYKL
eukprot:435643_1